MIPRKTKHGDLSTILDLYRSVATKPGGIARHLDEITESYVGNFLNKTLHDGIGFVIDDPERSGKLAAEIHAYKPGIKVFDHVLSELTVVVHPAMQGRGLGKKLFMALLDEIQMNRKDILRVELIARESNAGAIALYEKLGFRKEGRFENRIRSVDGGFEADIPMAWSTL